MTKTKNAKLDRTNQKELPLFLTLIFLWGQLYFTAIPTWRYANYYEHGWFVPPLALFFLFKHWKNFPPVEPKPKGETNLLLIAGLLLPFLVLIRILEGVDASWRPPILLHALLVVLSSHWIIWHFKGRATSLKLVPVTLFALSAIPYPYQLEVRVIGFLTNWVVQAAGLIFHLLGKAVIVTNGIIEYGGTKVEV